MSWPPDDVERVDIGHGVSWSRVVDTSSNWIGILEWHECGDRGIMAGGVYFENAPPNAHGPRWHLADGRREHLTITPSILCQCCGLHGFVTDGRWIPA